MANIEFIRNIKNGIYLTSFHKKFLQFVKDFY